MPHFELGSRVRDKVTGYTGVAVTETKHLNGCRQYGVQGPVDKDGKMGDGYTFDHTQLELVEEEAVVPKDTGDTGGVSMRISPNKL